MPITTSSTDRIEKEITLDAPRSRVWRALTDSAEFGTWFGVRLEGPFRVGERIQGAITEPGYRHLTFVAWVEAMEPERHFAFRWQPHAMDPAVDYSGDPTTLVRFDLTDVDGGTHLRVTESGFDGLPAEHRAEAFLRNGGGWTAQMENIKTHVDD